MSDEFDSTTAKGFKEHVKHLIKRCEYKRAIEFVNIKIDSESVNDMEFRE